MPCVALGAPGDRWGILQNTNTAKCKQWPAGGEGKGSLKLQLNFGKLAIPGKKEKKFLLLLRRIQQSSAAPPQPPHEESKVRL